MLVVLIIWSSHREHNCCDDTFNCLRSSCAEESLLVFTCKGYISIWTPTCSIIGDYSVNWAYSGSVFTEHSFLYNEAYFLKVVSNFWCSSFSILFYFFRIFLSYSILRIRSSCYYTACFSAAYDCIFLNYYNQLT